MSLHSRIVPAAFALALLAPVAVAYEATWREDFTGALEGYEVLEENGSIALDDGTLRMERASDVDGFAEVRRDLPQVDVSARFGLATRFQIPHADNHWFYVLDGYGGSLVVDYGTDLTWYNGRHQHLLNLQPGRWYDLGFCFDGATGRGAVTIDGAVVADGLTPRWASFPAALRMGEPADGGWNWGAGVWDEVRLVENCGTSAARVVWSDAFTGGGGPLPEGWVAHTAHGGALTLEEGRLHMVAPWYAGAAEVQAPLPEPDRSGSFGARTSFMIPHNNNHWFYALEAYGGSLVVDYGTTLAWYDGDWSDGSDMEDLASLEPGTWHDLGFCVADGTATVVLDGRVVGEGLALRYADAPAALRLGEPVDGGSNWGEAWWDHVETFDDCHARLVAAAADADEDGLHLRQDVNPAADAEYTWSAAGVRLFGLGLP